MSQPHIEHRSDTSTQQVVTLHHICPAYYPELMLGCSHVFFVCVRWRLYLFIGVTCQLEANTRFFLFVSSFKATLIRAKKNRSF